MGFLTGTTYDTRCYWKSSGAEAIWVRELLLFVVIQRLMVISVINDLNARFFQNGGGGAIT